MNTSSISTSFSILLLTASTVAGAKSLSPEEKLGKSIFFDENLSINRNQSCAACHAPEAGWTGPLSTINGHGAVYEGSIPGRFGNRKPPGSAYATQSTIFHFDKKGLFTGGNFWGGRATGDKFGNPAADQAQGPFLNPREQAMPDSACVVYRVCDPAIPGDYPVLFEEVRGDEACDIAWPADVDTVCATEGATVAPVPADHDKTEMVYDNIALSIAAFEGAQEVNAFLCKFDPAFAGVAKLSKAERRGYALFRGKGKCHCCHISNGKNALFTDNTFDNLGTPQNPGNPAGIAPDFVDGGLGGFLKNAGYPEEVYPAEPGKQKVPTLRNVGLGLDPGMVKAYSHNGHFKTLVGIVHFCKYARCQTSLPGALY
jgi:cytochrome c peroxidase